MGDWQQAAAGEVPDVVALTQQLVRLRSVNEATSNVVELPVADVLIELMQSFGWPVEVQQVDSGRPNVVALVEGNGGPGPTLMFEGHMDVVTEGPPELWSVPPYEGAIVDDRLYGRGSADMKSGLAAMICAARRLQVLGPFPGRIVVAALSDEEGIMLGAKHFAASPLAARIDAAIVCEPEAGEVCTSAKGAMRLQIDLVGVMAHGAMPHEGKNPIPCLAEIVASLAGLERELQAASGAADSPEVYLTPTVVSAGSVAQINVIPSRATLCVDIRTVPGIDHSMLRRRVESVVADACSPAGVAGDVLVIDDRPPVEIEADHPVVRALMAGHERVVGTPARTGQVPGTTDGTILWRDAGIPNVVYGPGGKWIAHQVDEFVDVRDIRIAERVYVEAARRYLRDAR